MPTKKINWRVYERDRLYPQGMSAYLDLIKLSPSKKYPYLANHYEVMAYCQDYFYWSRDADYLEKTLRRWLKKWLTDKTEFNKIFSLYRKSQCEVKTILLPLRDAELKNITDQELYNLYRQAQQVFLKSISFSEYTTDLFDDFFGKIFSEKLQLMAKNKINQTDLGQLMEPAYISESLLYKKNLLQFSLNKIVSQADLKKMAKRFGWIMMGWDGSNELTVGRIEKDIKKLKIKSFDLRSEELKRINNFIKSVEAGRNDLVNKYHLSFGKLKPYFHLLDAFAMFHDWRKETQMRSNQIIFPALRMMAKRFKLKYRDLVFYDNSEIKNLCLKNIKVDKSLIAERQQGLTWVIKRGKIKEYLGLEAKKILDKLVLSEIKASKTSQVTGVSASRGKVVGQAFVVKGAREALKIVKKGGVLVASMTTIDYLPAMRQAAAIVTDDGGITCHAAIVSRELGIPCIVGTKIATQVFKTGDRIEVDANEGIVKKI
ncbi:MAG: PEP-utilizing enzyme [Patescibacteria group bacterium]|jgi:phosphohistidine swiveling domain-containing protein